MPYYARLQPFNRPAGHLMRTHVTAVGTLWRAGTDDVPAPWQEIPAAHVAELQDLEQFEVRRCSLNDLHTVIAAEARQALEAGRPMVYAAVHPLPSNPPSETPDGPGDGIAPSAPSVTVESTVIVREEVSVPEEVPAAPVADTPEISPVAVPVEPAPVPPRAATGRDLTFLSAHRVLEDPPVTPPVQAKTTVNATASPAKSAGKVRPKRRR